jgi:hypothetical protein
MKGSSGARRLDRAAHHRPSPGQRWFLVLCTVLAVGLVAGVVVVAVSSEPADGRNPTNTDSGMSFGVLGGTCAPDRLEALRTAGVTVVEFDMGWDRYQPRPGVVDAAYVAELRGRIGACRNAGMDVILSLGLQSPPAWTRSLPSGMLLDRNGQPPTMGGGLDLVFSSAVRQAVADYFDRVAADVSFDGVLAIRLGTDGAGELAYPGPGEGSSPEMQDYWAFNAAAQDGTGIAEGMVPTPLPGWVPGTPTWQGTPVTTEQVAAWFRWYSRALMMAVSWQAQELRTLGFTGDFHVPVAGPGALPVDLDAAVRGNLDGRNDPVGALPRGLHYPDQFTLLAQLDHRLRAAAPGRGVAVDFTGLDDVSAVRARQLTPPRDACQPGDPERAAGGRGVEGWSGQRFTIATARYHGLYVIGENPGPSHLPNTGGSPDSDPLADQLVRAVQYARGCELSMFLFAFEDQLFDHSSGVGLDDYAREIARQ